MYVSWTVTHAVGVVGLFFKKCFQAFSVIRGMESFEFGMYFLISFLVVDICKVSVLLSISV